MQKYNSVASIIYISQPPLNIRINHLQTHTGLKVNAHECMQHIYIFFLIFGRLSLDGTHKSLQNILSIFMYYRTLASVHA